MCKKVKDQAIGNKASIVPKDSRYQNAPGGKAGEKILLDLLAVYAALIDQMQNDEIQRGFKTTEVSRFTTSIALSES